MTKARITYRFNNRDHRGQHRQEQEASRVIPLNDEEFHVVEVDERIEQQGPTGRNRENENASNNQKGNDHEDRMNDESFLPATEKSVLSEDPDLFQPLQTDYSAWTSSFDAETERIERLIRESEIPSPKREEPQWFDMPHREEEGRLEANPETGYFHSGGGRYASEEGPEIDWGPKYSTTSSPSRTTSGGSMGWLKITSTVLGAVVTGTLFGFFVLTMFADDGGSIQNQVQSILNGANLNNNLNAGGDGGLTGNQSPGNQTGNAPDNIVSAGTTVRSGASGKPGRTQGSAVPTTIPAETYFLLQNGVFSSSERADAAVQDLKDRGFAGLVQQGAQYSVFVGISSTKEEAEQLSRLVQESDAEIYIKAMELPGITNIRYNGDGADLPVLFNSGSRMIRMISSLTSIQLEQLKPQALEDSSYQSLEAEHQKWSRLSAAAEKDFPEDGQKVFSRMDRNLESAVVAIDEYQKRPTHAYLWQAQTSIMQAVAAQKELLTLLNAVE